MDLRQVVDDLIIPCFFFQNRVVEPSHSHHLTIILVDFNLFDENSQELRGCICFAEFDAALHHTHETISFSANLGHEQISAEKGVNQHTRAVLSQRFAERKEGEK